MFKKHNGTDKTKLYIHNHVTITRPTALNYSFFTLNFFTMI